MGNQQVEQADEVVGFCERDSRLYQKGLEKFLGALLGMEANGIEVRRFPCADFRQAVAKSASALVTHSRASGFIKCDSR